MREGIYSMRSYIINVIKYVYCTVEQNKISSPLFAFSFLQANDSACSHCCSCWSAPMGT